MHWRQIRSETGSRTQWYEQQKDVWEGYLDEFKTLIILPTLPCCQRSNMDNMPYFLTPSLVKVIYFGPRDGSQGSRVASSVP